MLLMALISTATAVASSYFWPDRVGLGRWFAAGFSIGSRIFSVHQFDRFSTASLITRTTNDTTRCSRC